MDPSAIAVRLASSAVGPLVKRLFVQGTHGAGLVDKPVRISALVSFKGEKGSLGRNEFDKLSAELVDRAAQSYGPHEAPSAEVRGELAHALALALHSLGDLEMDDVQAVRLGPEALAARLARSGHLSAAAESYYDPLLHAACLHILNFFTQRSTFVARTLVEQARSLELLIATTDLLIERIPPRSVEDARFEQLYTRHIARKYSELTIYGLDLNHEREWRLDTAYVSLELAHETAASIPAEQVLSGRSKVLLRGAAGSGKTTLVQWLAVTAAQWAHGRPARTAEIPNSLDHLVGRIPIVLPLRRVIRDGRLPTPDEFLNAVRSSVAGSQPPGWTDRVLGAGRALLLVDGIDEIPQREREETRRWLRELMGDFPGNLWLVTARPSAVGEDWLAREGFAQLSLSPMSRTDVTHFVRHWHRAVGTEPQLGEALLDGIRTGEDLGRLAVNPLMCGLLCALHRERRGFLPHGRRDLYDAALRMLLERRDVERGVRPDDGLRLSSETQILLLQKLAHWLIRNSRVEMEHADAVTQLERSLGYMAHVQASPERVLRHLLERSGLLREPATGRIDFVHRTFQDYLGAKAMVEEGDFPLLLDNAHKDQWEDVVRMSVALGRPAERDRILTGLVTGIEGTHLGRDLYDRPYGRSLSGQDLRRVLMAATCLEHATEVSPEVRRHVIDLTGQFIPPNTRRRARNLAEFGGPIVLGLLPGPDELTDGQAENVIITATRIGTDAALPVLARFSGHPALSVRRQLAWSWMRFDTQKYAEDVLAHLDGTDLYFTAHNIDHLHALRDLGGRARIQLVGIYRSADLVENLDPESLTHLWLRDGFSAVMGDEWLAAFPRLHTIAVPERSRGAAVVPPHITVTRVPAGQVI
ncbi:NACHT domain-containing protein [Streptomyces albipurpureus]|uniref:NACHT domain-containing protein n=1 Tax=Streptomyces albipurpureus TaxID=2897419 RepID=A0ABT0UY14_9ACTN|nr:NACHT domain-containing protein [Streptomyces sp. CWNU-1]MCM2393360.1 NACHT domain-containing protein [Streptomyces sp. CWNU-1]